jgi:hypothetical protein
LGRKRLRRRRWQDGISALTRNHPAATKGLQKVADSTPKLIEKLQRDLKNSKGPWTRNAIMNELVPIIGERASYRFFEFFAAQIRNPSKSL